MIDKHANIFSIKHVVLTEVARHAYIGDLDEVRDQLPFEMIPGPNANFRCCVYREREIIRQRIRLAEGKSPDGKDSKGIIQVISSACEDCPITRFSVTSNCQRCMSRRCNRHVSLVLSQLKMIVLISILPFVKNVENVLRPVHITQLQT